MQYLIYRLEIEHRFSLNKSVFKFLSSFLVKTAKIINIDELGKQANVVLKKRFLEIMFKKKK